MLIRPAVPDDRQDIVDIEMRARWISYSDFMPEKYLASLRLPLDQRWRIRLSGVEPQLTTLVATLTVGMTVDGVEIGPPVVGFTRFGRGLAVPPSPDFGELEYLYVDPKYWGMGYGKALLDAAEDGLRRLGYSGAFLAVYEENHRARHFYEREGWQFNDERWMVDRGGVSVAQMRYAKHLIPAEY